MEQAVIEYLEHAHSIPQATLSDLTLLFWISFIAGATIRDFGAFIVWAFKKIIKKKGD